MLFPCKNLYSTAQSLLHGVFYILTVFVWCFCPFSPHAWAVFIHCRMGTPNDLIIQDRMQSSCARTQILWHLTSLVTCAKVEAEHGKLLHVVIQRNSMFQWSRRVRSETKKLFCLCLVTLFFPPVGACSLCKLPPLPEVSTCFWDHNVMWQLYTVIRESFVVKTIFGVAYDWKLNTRNIYSTCSKCLNAN